MLTREQILARKMGRDVLAIDDAGGTVAVRGLNRTESIAVGEEQDHAVRDRMIIHFGLVDPALSIEDIAAWQEQDGGGPDSALEKVSRKISELSGMVEGAGKSDVPAAGEQS